MPKRIESPLASARSQHHSQRMNASVLLVLLCLVGCGRTIHSAAQGPAGRGASGTRPSLAGASASAGSDGSFAGAGGGAGTSGSFAGERAGASGQTEGGRGGSLASAAGFGGASTVTGGNGGNGDQDICPRDPSTPAGYHKLVVVVYPSFLGLVSTSPAAIDQCPSAALDFTCDPPGPHCHCMAPGCTALFEHGTRIGLHAEALRSSVLHRWRGDCPDDGRRSVDVTITLDRDMTCIAEFGQ
jgi:hypothetical protein